MKKIPTFHQERALHAQGITRIVGVDEVGCGALAGPVVAGAAIFPVTSRLGLVRDSKLLSPSQREGLFTHIQEKSLAWATGLASPEEIASFGLREATYMAMRRAIEQIEQVEHVLVDAWTIPGLSVPQKGIIRGDQSVKSIAAASILAKVVRDRMMVEYAKEYPVYGFEAHKGYATKQHRDAIKQHGPCEIHRLNYKTFHQTLF